MAPLEQASPRALAADLEAVGLHTDLLDAEALADQIRTRIGKPRPAFMNLFVAFWGADMSKLKKTLGLLGPQYLAVTPSHLNTLYRASARGK